MNKMIDKIKNNLMISILLGVAFIGATLTGAIAGLENIDSLVITEAEHDADPHIHLVGLRAQAEAIEGLKQWNRCDRLERRSGELSDRLWRLQQATNTAAITIRDVKSDLSLSQRQFNDLTCGVMLSSGG